MTSQLFDLRNTDRIVTYELRESLAWLGLNRPHKRNAIDSRVLGALQESVTRAQAEAQAMVIFGHGPCFSAGLDLAEHRTRGARRRRFITHALGKLSSPRSVGAVCRPSPHCMARPSAAGWNWRRRVISGWQDTTAFFALPEGMRGIYVGGGASVHVARLLGAARMADMMLTGRVLDAAMAERVGLVQYLAPKGEALARRGATSREDGRDGSADRARGAARAAAHPGYERRGRALRREPDGGPLSVRCGGRGAACGFHGKAGAQGDAALRVISRCLAKNGFSRRFGRRYRLGGWRPMVLDA